MSPTPEEQPFGVPPGDVWNDVPLFREIQRVLMSSSGPVNWELARQVGIASASWGTEDPAPSEEDRRGFDEAVRVAELQVDNAILFEGVNNTLKLLGDQYLARVSRLINRRFHLDEWDSSIIRKLQTLESIYEKIADQASTRRLEILEWVIILLIAFSILLEFI